MRAELILNGNPSAAARYVGWAPVPAQVRITDPTGATGPSVTVRLRNRNPNQGGQVEFFAAVPGPAQPELQLILPVAGIPVDLQIAGQFGRPSSEDGDAAVEIEATGSGEVLAVAPL